MYWFRGYASKLSKLTGFFKFCFPWIKKKLPSGRVTPLLLSRSGWILWFHGRPQASCWGDRHGAAQLDRSWNGSEVPLLRCAGTCIWLTLQWTSSRSSKPRKLLYLLGRGIVFLLVQVTELAHGEILCAGVQSWQREGNCFSSLQVGFQIG